MSSTKGARAGATAAVPHLHVQSVQLASCHSQPHHKHVVRCCCDPCCIVSPSAEACQVADTQPAINGRVSSPEAISYATVLCKRTLTSWQKRPRASAGKAADSCCRAGAESGVSGAQDITCLYCTRGLSVTASTSCRAGASTMSFCWQSLHQPIMLTVTAALFKVELQAPCMSM